MLHQTNPTRNLRFCSLRRSLSTFDIRRSGRQKKADESLFSDYQFIILDGSFLSRICQAFSRLLSQKSFALQKRHCAVRNRPSAQRRGLINCEVLLLHVSNYNLLTNPKITLKSVFIKKTFRNTAVFVT